MELVKAGFVPASRDELLVAAVKKLHSNKRGDSMRSAARLKMGYYPLPESEGKKLRALLSFPSAASVIDPCIGQGTALELVTSDAPIRCYGVELDTERARIAGSKGIETIRGNTRGPRCASF